MDNNTIHPDEMERLLRETFLNSPLTDDEQLTDMMAEQAYSTNWNITPPINKVAKFIPKKGFFRGFSLNIFIAATLMIGAGIGIYFFTKSDATSPVSLQSNLNNNTSKNITPLVDTSEITPKNIAQNISQKPSKKIVNSEMNKRSEQLDSIVIPVPPVKEPRKPGQLPKVKPRRYILIPDISEYEARENEKRKKEMVNQLINFSQKQWAFIPMGTTNINGESVSIQAYHIMKYEVTNLQYKTFLFDLVIKEKLREYQRAAVYDSGWAVISKLDPLVKEYFWNPAYNDYPVVNISEEGARMFCDWLTIEANTLSAEKNKELINDVRLPTYHEWIYAAKGGNDSAVYAWGGPFYRNSKGMILGNFQSGRDLNDDDGTDVTAPVSSFSPNPYGLYNMSGNVAEMTRPYTVGKMFIKGGAWNRKQEYMKLDHEYTIEIDDLPSTNVGFRPVVTYFKGQLNQPTEK